MPAGSGLLAGRHTTVYPGTLEKLNLSDTSLVKTLLGNDKRSDAENTPQHL